MFFHDVPYESDPTGVWVLKTANGFARRFTSRFAALAFATDDAAECTRAGSAMVIRVEGADGVWRAFDARMKGVPCLPEARHG
jgi:hypothetical protein